MGRTGTVERGVAVVHLMKTGGTSLDEAVHPILHPDVCFPRGDDGQSFGQKWQTQALLDLPLEQRSRLKFVSVHMPAWVVERAVPHLPTATVVRDPVDRTVSHLRQIKRDRFTDWSLDRIWEHPPLQERLTNYQTRMLCATAPQDETHNASPIIDRSSLTDDERRHIAEAVAANALTGMQHVTELDESSRRRALDTLATVDFLGTTGTLGAYVRAIGVHLGLDLGNLAHKNRARDAESPSAHLRRQIADHCALDAELYEMACSRGTP